MAGSYKTRADDIRALEILDARFNSGLSSVEVREKFGLSNSALQGLVFRTVRDKTPCVCTKAENKDGGMPARWWAK